MTKTCYRCGKTYNTKQPYCRACMIKMATPQEQPHLQVKKFNLLSLLGIGL
jgi:ribosomal protein L37E